MYGIMRAEKGKRADVYGLQIEHDRQPGDEEKRTFKNDIDWERTAQNEYLVHSENWNESIKKRLQKDGLKPRKDSVLIIDSLYTITPEWFESHTQEEARQYFQDCLDFHVKTYCQGDKSLVLDAVIHNDEKTPHMHLVSIPIVRTETGPKLSAKIVMGNRGDYTKRQTAFWKEVGQPRGLERGEIKAESPENTRVHVETAKYHIEQAKKREQEAQESLEITKTVIEAIEEGRRNTAPIEVLAHTKAKKGLFGADTPETKTLSAETADNLIESYTNKVQAMNLENNLNKAYKQISEEIKSNRTRELEQALDQEKKSHAKTRQRAQESLNKLQEELSGVKATLEIVVDFLKERNLLGEVNKRLKKEKKLQQEQENQNRTR